MNIETTVAVYLIVWWVVLFSVLPVGVVSHAEAGVDAARRRRSGLAGRAEAEDASSSPRPGSRR